MHYLVGMAMDAVAFRSRGGLTTAVFPDVRINPAGLEREREERERKRERKREESPASVHNELREEGNVKAGGAR